MKNTIPEICSIKRQDYDEKIKEKFNSFITKKLKATKMKSNEKYIYFYISEEFYSARKILKSLLKEKNWKSRWKCESGSIGGDEVFSPDIYQLRLSYKQYYTRNLGPC